MSEGPSAAERGVTRLLIGAAALGLAGGVAAGVAAHAETRARPVSSLGPPALYGQVVWAAAGRQAPAFLLPDQRGATVSLAGLRGRAVLLAFVDPLCATGCRREGMELVAAQRDTAPAARPALLIVSVNPRATSADAAVAGRAWGLGRDWHWLVGGIARLEPVWRAYGVERAGRGSTVVYVIDRLGFERAGVHAPFLPQFVADDFDTLLREAG